MTDDMVQMLSGCAWKSTIGKMSFFRRPAPHNPLTSVPLLNAQEQAALANRHTVVRLQHGAKVCRQGRTGNELMFVLEGTADVCRNGQYVSSVAPGAVLGERSMLAVRVFQDADVIATSDMTVAVVSRREFLDAVGELPSLRSTLSAVAASRT